MNEGAATWEGANLTLGQIDAQLQRLWRAADSKWDGQGRRPDIRTSVLNLIVYARNQACVDRAGDAIQGLAGTHPSRSLIIEPGEPHRNPSSIDCRLAIQSHGAYAEFQQVCSEELVLKVHGQAAQHLSSIVVPLLAPDLPVFVWWPGETPFHHHMYHQLRDLADRFVVDSADFSKPAEDLVTMAGAVRASARCAFSDFSWARLAPWRDIVASFFDLQRFRPALDRLRSVHVRCRPEGTANGLDVAQSLLLSGWIASALGFQATDREVSDSHFTLHCAKDSQQLSFHIDADASALSDVSVVLKAQATASDQAAEFMLAVDAGGQVTATAEVAEVEALHRKTRVDERQEGFLLFQELEMFDRDPEYERSLLCASSMLDPRYHPAQVRGSLLV